MCEHIYKHLETRKLINGDLNYKEKSVNGNTYIKTYTFYCQKCLDIIDIRKEVYIKTGERIPEWFRES